MEIYRIDLLTVIVSVLGMLTTILIGWQILQTIYIDKKVDRRVKEKLKEYNKDVQIKLSLSKMQLYDAIRMSEYEIKNYGAIAIISSYIPKEIAASADPEYGFEKEMAKLRSFFDNSGYALKEEDEKRLMKSYLPYANYRCVFDFLSNISKCKEEVA